MAAAISAVEVVRATSKSCINAGPTDEWTSSFNFTGN
jgi:hypothetical protein